MWVREETARVGQNGDSTGEAHSVALRQRGAAPMFGSYLGATFKLLR